MLKLAGLALFLFIAFTSISAALDAVFDETPAFSFGRNESIKFWQPAKPFEEPVSSEQQRAGEIWRAGENKK